MRDRVLTWVAFPVHPDPPVDLRQTPEDHFSEEYLRLQRKDERLGWREW